MTKQEIIDKVMKPIEDSGFEVFFVGGCVRDSILGREPHDYDIVTSALPSDLHNIFKRFSNVSANSENYGVTIVLIECGDESGRNFEEFEIATFRTDTSKGRRPSVALGGNIETDSRRRDFTINSLYERANGEILDPTGLGLQDIRDRKIRFVGSAEDRIDEDPLRALRLIRFVSKLGFDFVN